MSHSLTNGPFVGLTPFAADDAEVFFGRDAEAEVVAANLMSRPLTVLFGQTGVGKSSLLNAGVEFALRRLEDTSDVDRDRSVLAICREWRDDAIEEIARCLRAAVPELEGFSHAGGLAGMAHAVVDARGELFLVLDQFEEYFLYHSVEDDRELAWQLRQLLSDRSLPVSILISLRDDALARLDRLREIPRLFDNRLEIRQLSFEQARAAIEGPLNAFNLRNPDEAVTIESALVDELLQQISVGSLVLARDEPAVDQPHVEAPLLQLVLMRLWQEERVSGSSVLRVETLERLGGTRYIVGTLVDRAVDGLRPEERELAAEFFRFLVTPSGMKISMAASDLAAYVGAPLGSVTAALEHLAAGSVRLLRVTAGLDGTSRYELYHDILVAPVVDWSERRRGEDEWRRLDDRHRRERRLRQQRRVMLAIPWLIVAVLLALLLL